MLQFVLGTAGSGKTWYVRNLIADKVKSGENGILLLVPEQNNYESERAMLRLLGSASSDVVEVSSFTSLARNLAAICGSDALRVADDGIKLLMMGRAVNSVKNGLKMLGKSGASRTLCEKLLEFHTELKRSDVSADKLLRASTKLNGAVSSKISDISVILGAYEGLLANRFSDPLDDLVKLGENLNTVSYFSGRTVVIDAFKGFTEQQYKIISHILRQAKEVYITVCADSLEDKSEGTGIFANNKAAAAHLLMLAHKDSVKVAPPITVSYDYRFNNTVIRSVEQVLCGKQAGETVGGELTVCACSSAYDEADYIARTVKKLVRTQGYRYRDFAVVARDMTEYRNLLCDAFERYGVACFSDMRTDAGSLSLFRYVLGIAYCAVYGIKNDIIMQCIKSAVSGFTVEQAAMLDNYALIWNIKSSSWKEEWTQNPNGLDEQLDTELLKQINRLRERAVEPIIKLAESLISRNARTVCKCIYDILVAVGADKSLSRLADEFESRNDFYSADIHRQSYSALMECLDNAVRVFDGEECDKHELYDMLEILLTSCDIGSIPDKIDEVVIGSADRIRAGNPKVTFIIGANYSLFPKPIGKGGLLSLAERRRVINVGIDIPDFERNIAVDEQFYIYSALSTPSERLLITYHTSSVSGDKSMPAEFIEKLFRAIPEARLTKSSESETDRFEGVLPSVELVCTEQYRQYAQSLKTQLLQRGISAGSISLNGPTAADAAITSDNAIRLFGSSIRMSASKAETYAHCPFSYFCQFGLSAKPLRTAELDVMRRGTLVHYVLEKSVKMHGRAISELEPKQRMSEISELLHEYADMALGGYSKLDKGFLFLLDRIALLLDRLLSRLGEEMAQSDFTPDRFELKIGGDEVAAVNIPLDYGSLSLTGYVDRVDIFTVDQKTYVRVVDYKTGSKKFDLSDIFYGMNMQMLIYLFAVVASDIYKNPVASGVLYMPSARPIHTADRRIDENELSSLDDEKLRMNGLLLDDKTSLAAMEKDGLGRFIPYKQKAGRSVQWIADSSAFSELEKQVKKLLMEAGNSIHSGKIGANPIDSTGTNACKYCDYASVCLRDADMPHETVVKLKLSEALIKLSGGDENGI